MKLVTIDLPGFSLTTRQFWEWKQNRGIDTGTEFDSDTGDWYVVQAVVPEQDAVAFKLTFCTR